MNEEKKADQQEEPLAHAGKSTIGDQNEFSRTIDTEFDLPDEGHEKKPLQVGDSLGKYEIRRKLGKGGMGEVFLAFDPMIEREVAIKVLPREVSSQEKALGRFLSEARATGKLNHPHVVAIYDIGHEEGIYYIVMELVSGGSVADHIANRTDSDWRDACRIAAEACEGLAAAHAQGLVHRDIKPENLMLTNSGSTKVVDFGLSKLTDATQSSSLSLTNEGQILGTPHYMSPEQFQGQQIDARSDVYAMGGTLFCLLTGSPPFGDAPTIVNLMNAHLQKTPPDPAATLDHLPKKCGEIIRKAMAKSPDQRYENAGEMAAAIRDLISKESATTAGRVIPEEKDLRSAIIVEPSRMQSLMMRNAIQHTGARTVEVCGTAEDASRLLEQGPPDLLITAMELSDGRGIDVIDSLRRISDCRDTVAVLNSTDLNAAHLQTIQEPAPFALVSKKTKPDELLRALHACTHLTIADSSDASPPELSSRRFGFVCDSSRVPHPIAALIREGNLMQVSFATIDEMASHEKELKGMDMLFAIRNAGDSSNDDWIYVELLERLNQDAPLCAAVQVDGQVATLRAVHHGEFLSSLRYPLTVDRMTRLHRLI